VLRQQTEIGRKNGGEAAPTGGAQVPGAAAVRGPRRRRPPQHRQVSFRRHPCCLALPADQNLTLRALAGSSCGTSTRSSSWTSSPVSMQAFICCSAVPSPIPIQLICCSAKQTPAVSAPAGFPDHPHRGFETVTYMLEVSRHHACTIPHSFLPLRIQRTPDNIPASPSARLT
jgi:hypothetical protein